MTEQQSKKVHGFKFAARSAGIKKSGRPDLAVIFSEVPARCAGVFTTNKVVAAPVVVTLPRIRRGFCQAVLVNSGNANACTGEQGMKDALHCAELAAIALGLPEDLVAVASTGVIGVPLPMEKLERHVPLLAGELDAGAAAEVAEAMRTTDAFAKVAARTSADGRYSILGLAKGAGMIHPDMATMLAFILTDAAVAGDCLERSLRLAVADSFNAATVDGDTSTNDTVLLLANGLAGNDEIRSGTPQGEEFARLLGEVALELARMIVRDGEGATKLVRIQVRGAKTGAEARLAARSIATSTLVKTAFFGEDANWGRIIAAAGYSGAEIDPARVEILFNDVVVVRGGLGTGPEQEARATRVLKTDEFTVTVDLHLGEGQACYHTSDLGYEYVKINAAYRT